MINQYQCTDCQDSFHDSLDSLLKHKRDECPDSHICLYFRVNVSEYHLMKHMMCQITKQKTPLGGKITLRFCVFSDFFKEKIEETKDTQNQGLTLRSIWDTYVRSCFYKKGVLKKHIKKYIDSHGYPFKQGYVQGKHQKYIFHTLKWKD